MLSLTTLGQNCSPRNSNVNSGKNTKKQVSDGAFILSKTSIRLQLLGLVS
jgi:hypothetical protein